MVKAPEVLGLIIARGGSKSVPRKNLRLLNGIPLIAYSILTTLRAGTVNRVVVSTEDPEIAEVARQYGAETPFMRPMELATDLIPDLPVFAHALNWLKDQESYVPDIVVQLRATSPFCSPEEVDEGVTKLWECPEADSLRLVCPTFQNPYKMWQMGDDGYIYPITRLAIHEPYNQPRQKLPQAYFQHQLDITRPRTVLDLKSMTGNRILPLMNKGEDWTTWIDIDTEDTLQIAEFLLKSGKISIPHLCHLFDQNGGEQPNKSFVYSN